jgi:hypothetical protein
MVLKINKTGSPLGSTLTKTGSFLFASFELTGPLSTGEGK